MSRFGAAVVLAIVLVALVEGRPEKQEPRAAGTTYDEIVVETQLAVRPKAPSAGLSLRSGRAKAPKAVFFRPNATTSSSSVSSTPSDGISYAARVVGVENPLATAARARSAATGRARRESAPSAPDASPGSPGGFSSSSWSSYSYESSSNGGSKPVAHASGSSGGFFSGTPPDTLAAAAPYTFTSGTSGSSTAKRKWTQTLPNGQTVSVDEQAGYAFAPGQKPTGSKLVTVLVSGHGQ